MKKKQTFLWSFLVISFCIAAILLQGPPSAIYKKSRDVSNMYYLPGHSWLKVFSLGYYEATADFIWVKFIIYFSTAPKEEVKEDEFVTREFREKQKKEAKLKNYSLNYIDAATQLDPRFQAAYMHGSRLAMYHQGVLSKDTIETAIEILKKGLTHYPNNGEMLFNLGFLYYYEIIPFIDDDETVDRLQQEGTRYIQKSSLSPGAPPYVAELSNVLLSRHKMNDLMVEHLKHQILAETNPDIRRNLVKSLKEALGEQRQSDLLQLEALHRKWKKQYSFVPMDLYTILAPKQNNINPLFPF